MKKYEYKVTTARCYEADAPKVVIEVLRREKRGGWRLVSTRNTRYQVEGLAPTEEILFTFKRLVSEESE
ncbi:MAG: hypothetical protein NZ551_04560 [Microscillaceae bacterium]|nr:hypothetical protein [Microscillaceae bacterium]MDW8460464.1 hypothetical protein [Cytophagales bacterium]